MQIRDIEKSDIHAVLQIIRAKAEFDGCLDSLRTTEEDIDSAFFSHQPKARAIVAEVSGKLVGIATYYSIYSTFIAKPGLWLDDLYVYREHRKSGAGKALIQKLCSIAKATGCGRIDWIVARDNHNGRGFYESVGANIFEDIRHARLDEDAIHKLAIGV